MKLTNRESLTLPLTNETLARAAQSLAARDKHFRSIHQTHGPPPMWGRRPGFTTLLRIILEQQVSLISARSMYERLRANIEPFDTATFIERGELYLRSLGMTRQKAHYAIQLAKLGGYLARKADAPPGNMVLWRGFSRLTDIHLGVEIGAKLVGN